MRYVLAIAALVLSGVLLVLGIGQRTFLAGPSEISYSLSEISDTEYAVIPGDVFDEVPGQANLVVNGENAFVAVGSSRDVGAWVAPYAHAELVTDRENTQLLSSVVAAEADPEAEEGAEAPATLDPRGSDLWVEEESVEASADDAEAGAEEAETPASEGSATRELRVPLKLASGQSVLVAADGTEPVSGDVSIVWVQDRNTPLAGPLLAGSALFALVGGVLYLLAIDRDRRALGPRRGRRGPLLGIRNVFGGQRRARKSAERADPAGAAPADGTPEAQGAEPGTGAGKERKAVKSKKDKQRGRSERRARRLAVPVIGLTAMLGLSGCSPTYWPDFSSQQAEDAEPEPTTKDSDAVLPVTDAQVDTILQRVAKVAGESDDALDAGSLEARFTGDALAERTANYKIRAAVPEYEVVPPRITAEELGYELVQSTEGWPRTIFATVASETADGAAAEQEDEPAAEADAAEADAAGDGDAEDAPAEEETASSPSLAMILTQQSPHENYLVSRVISLRGGISMPEAAPAEEGTALLANDLQTLMLPPEEVGSAYASVLAEGAGSEQAELFMLEGDPLVERSGLAWAEQANANAEGDSVRYSAAARQGEERVVALSTGVGGALVSATVIEDRIEDSEGRPAGPTASASVNAVSGLEGRQELLVREIAHQVLFYVPSQSSGAPIEVLGVTTGMVGARNQR